MLNHNNISNTTIVCDGSHNNNNSNNYYYYSKNINNNGSTKRPPVIETKGSTSVPSLHTVNCTNENQPLRSLTGTSSASLSTASACSSSSKPLSPSSLFMSLSASSSFSPLSSSNKYTSAGTANGSSSSSSRRNKNKPHTNRTWVLLGTMYVTIGMSISGLILWHRNINTDTITTTLAINTYLKALFQDQTIPQSKYNPSSIIHKTHRKRTFRSHKVLKSPSSNIGPKSTNSKKDTTQAIPLVLYGHNRITKEELLESNNNNNNNNYKSNEDLRQQSNQSQLLPHIPSRFAYAFLIGGVNPNRHMGYRGFIYNVLVAKRILHHHYSSPNDVWLMVQMVPDDNNNDNNNETQTSPDGNYQGHDDNDNHNENDEILELPFEDYELLRNNGIHIWYLPQGKTASFAETVFQKLRILQMTEYERVMFLDADIMPTYNLDYIFHLTTTKTTTSIPNDSTTTAADNTAAATVYFQPNLIVATRGEPCNAGLFVLEPYLSGYNDIELIIERQRKHAIEMNLSYPFFDKVNGWGHSFLDNNNNNNVGTNENDKNQSLVQIKEHWNAIVQQGQRWNYHASHSDQGLLYYFTKYYLQSVTIVIGHTIENWEPLSSSSMNMKRDDIKSTKLYGVGHSMPVKTRTYRSTDIDDTMIASILDPKSNEITTTTSSTIQPPPPLVFSKTCWNYNHSEDYDYLDRIQKKRQTTTTNNTNTTTTINDQIKLPFKRGLVRNSFTGQMVLLYKFECYPIYRHYQHFYGKTKPWQRKNQSISYYIVDGQKIFLNTIHNNNNSSSSSTSNNPTNDTITTTSNYNNNYYYNDPYVLWFQTLREVIQDTYFQNDIMTTTTSNNSSNNNNNNDNNNNSIILNNNYISIDHNNRKLFFNWWMNHSDTIKESPLGYLATFHDHSTTIRNSNPNNNNNNSKKKKSTITKK